MNAVSRLMMVSGHAMRVAPTLATPLWIPQAFWLSGLCFFVLSLTFLSVYGFVALVRGDWATIGRIAGVKSVEQEISEETHV